MKGRIDGVDVEIHCLNGPDYSMILTEGIEQVFLIYQQSLFSFYSQVSDEACMPMDVRQLLHKFFDHQQSNIPMTLLMQMFEVRMPFSTHL